MPWSELPHCGEGTRWGCGRIVADHGCIVTNLLVDNGGHGQTPATFHLGCEPEEAVAYHRRWPTGEPYYDRPIKREASS